MRKSMVFGLAPMFIWIGLFAPPPVAAVSFPLYNTGSETIAEIKTAPQYTHEGQTYGPFEWFSSYTQKFDGTSVTKHVGLNFVFSPQEFTPAQQSAFQTAAKSDIEGIWNNKVVIVDASNSRTIPLRVDVTTTGPIFHQTVKVAADAGRSNNSIWYAGSLSPGVKAHEFGHYLGLYDEYIGGGLAKYPSPVPTSGLMGNGALDQSPRMSLTYYQTYLDFMSALNPGYRFALNFVTVAPEPSTLLLFLSGIGACLASRTVWRSRLRN
jgi:hypothetical protein